MRFSVDDAVGEVAGLLERPPDAEALYVLAHGAGAGMRHAFMDGVATALAARRIATFRYQFPFTEAGRKRPDHSKTLTATVRAAVAAAAAAAPDLPLIAGGKSMGGRMTSLAAAEAPLSAVRGLVFLGFPLHAPKRDGVERAAHLTSVALPMLFVQGTRDNLARFDLIERVVASLAPRARLHVADGGDHGFHVLKRSGRTDAELLEELADAVATFCRACAAARPPA